MSIGKEAGTAQGTTAGVLTVEDRLTALEAQVAGQGLKLDEILRLLSSMAPPARLTGSR